MGNTDFKNALPVGTKLDGGRYYIEKVLGAGGFGITYRVSTYDGNIRQRRAVKEFFMPNRCGRQGLKMVYSDPVKAEVEAGMDSFYSEASRLKKADIIHTNIVGINNVFKENGTVYYVMEYISGMSLQEYVGNIGQLEEKDAKNIITPLLKAVSMLHAHNITHLDIKPDNIILNKDEDTGRHRPVLIDFGLSKHYDNNGLATSDFKFWGLSRGYAPCEQYEQGGMKEFTPQADVYALAATLFFMLTGYKPWDASDVTRDKLLGALPDSVSEGTRLAIVNAMKMSKSERTQSVSAFAEALGIDIDSYEDSNKTELILPRSKNKTVEYIKKHKSMLLTVASLLLCVMACILLWSIWPKDIFKVKAQADEQVEAAVEAQVEAEAPVGPEIPTEQETPVDMESPVELATPVVPAQPVVASPPKSPETPTTPVKPATTTTPTSPVTTNPPKEQSGGGGTTDVTTPPPVKSKTGTLNLKGAVWTGEITKGKPDGEGTMKYTAATKIAGHEIKAGWRIKGVWEDGKLVVGDVYDDKNNRQEPIMP